MVTVDYPDRWKEKLADEEERREVGRRHWRPKGAWVLALVVAAALFAIIFWPGGCGAGG